MKKNEHDICDESVAAAAWVLGQLRGAEQSRFEGHRQQCAACAGEAASFEHLIHHLRSFPQAQVSSGFTARLMQAVAKEEQREAREPSPWAIGAALALAASLMVVAGIVAQLFFPCKRVAVPVVATAAEMTPADWLVAHQEADGSWLPSRCGGNDAYRPAITALALMAVREEAPERHAEALGRAVAALQAMQQEDGSFNAEVNSARLYNHAFATHALQLMASDAPFKGHLQANLAKAVNFTCRSQNSQGGWDYEREGGGNTALSVWQLTLLATARAQGWEDSAGHLRRGLAWLRGQANAEGQFGYRQPGQPQPGQDGVTLTAMSAATLQAAARDFPALLTAARSAIEALRKGGAELPKPKADYYRDYFVALAFDEADDHNTAEKIAGAVKARRAEAADSAPWSANDPWGKSGGDYYATAMALLTIKGS